MDLYDMVLELVLSSSITIEYDSRVIDIDHDTPAVMLADGQVIDADLIVGADGVNSVVRPKLPDGDQPLVYGTYSNYS